MDFRAIINEIEGDENKRRKAEHQKRSDIYNDYQANYILKMLVNEFGEKTVREMRTCLSINLTKKIIQEQASIYKRSPKRMIENEGILDLYAKMKVDTVLKRANEKYKLHNQCCIQVIPKNGKIKLKLLAPHQYDVVPMYDDQEQAFAYVISSYNKEWLQSENEGNVDIQGNYYGSKNNQASDKINQKIADEDDWKTSKRYVVWTKELNFVMDGNGKILESYPNPIGMLPFIDIASEKEFEFWVKKGSGVCDFNLDFSVVLSDSCNTNRLQSYAQPVITAEKVPENVTVGPQNILFLPLDPTRPEMRPAFEFASPSPDLKASLDLQDRLLSYFLTANGVAPKAISGDGTTEKYSSGVERLLAMIERFEASQSDIDLFHQVEEELFQLIKAWYTVLHNTQDFDQSLNFGVWPEDVQMQVKFMGPEVVQTETDKEDSVIKRLEYGLISKAEAIAELREIPIDQAELKAREIEGIAINQ